MKPRDIEKAMLALLAERGTATACPSEVARKIGGTGWRAQMRISGLQYLRRKLTV